MWSQVDDFKWLRSEQSPNWGVIPEKERVGEEVWRKLLAKVPKGEEGEGEVDLEELKEILPAPME